MKPTLTKKDEKVLYYILLGFLLLFAAGAIILRAAGIRLIRIMPGCPFHAITGLYCPGCGGTHAVDALLSLHFLQSFLYHPLVPYAAATGGWYFLSHTAEYLSKGRYPVGMRYRDIYLYIGLAILIINWVVRNSLLIVCGICIF